MSQEFHGCLKDDSDREPDTVARTMMLKFRTTTAFVEISYGGTNFALTLNSSNTATPTAAKTV